MKNYKEGDITENGWEVISVNYKPNYKMRKRIVINSEHNNLKDVLGYHYFDTGFNWFETDNGKPFRLRENEYEYVTQQMK